MEYPNAKIGSVPGEILIKILGLLDRRDQWALAKSCTAIYEIAKEYVLFSELHSGRAEAFRAHRDESPGKGLEDDIRDVKKFEIGHLIREAKLFLERAAPVQPNEDPELELISAVEELIPLMLNVLSIVLRGRNMPKVLHRAICLVFTHCPRLSQLSVIWGFDAVRSTIPLPDLPISPRGISKLDLEMYQDMTFPPETPTANIIPDVAPPLIASTFGALRTLKVDVGSNFIAIEQDIIPWEMMKRTPNSELVHLEQSLGFARVEASKATAEIVLANIAKCFSGVHKVVLREPAYSYKFPTPGLSLSLHQIPFISHFASLTKCQYVEMATFGPETELLDWPESVEELQEYVEASLNWQLHVLAEIADAMPCLTEFEWTHWMDELKYAGLGFIRCSVLVFRNAGQTAVSGMHYKFDYEVYLDLEEDDGVQGTVDWAVA